MLIWFELFHSESRLKQETSIAAQAVLELGLTELAEGNTDEAKKWIDKCLKDYNHYLNENYVHLRAYAGLREMGISTDKDKMDATQRKNKRWTAYIRPLTLYEKSCVMSRDVTLYKVNDLVFSYFTHDLTCRLYCTLYWSTHF